IPREILVDGLHPGRLDVGRRREIGLPGAEAHHVDALPLQLLDTRRERQRGGFRRRSDPAADANHAGSSPFRGLSIPVPRSMLQALHRRFGKVYIPPALEGSRRLESRSQPVRRAEKSMKKRKWLVVSLSILLAFVALFAILFVAFVYNPF